MSYDTSQFWAIQQENEARNNPAAYRLRVFLLGMLGYFYVFLILALAVALVGLLIAMIVFVCRYAVSNIVGSINMLKLLIPATLAVGAFAQYIVRSLWVQVDPPTGMEIERSDAVPLFLEIDRLQKGLGVPRFHHVLLTDDMNAAVVGVPRLGLFGWQEYYLLIGVPLLAVLTPDRFRAVLAHEMGHIAASQGRFNGWVYRLWQTWLLLLQNLIHDDHGGALIFLWFFAWYAPLFDRATFGLRRLNEFECDRLAGQAVGARTMAEALLALELFHRQMSQPNPGPLDPRVAQKWLNEAMDSSGDPDSTHPSLAARLRALGERADAPEMGGGSALDRYLGHRAATLAQGLGIEIRYAPRNA